MKRSIKFITITLAVLLTLTACGSSARTGVTDGDSVIADIKGTTITKNDVYEYSKLKFGLNLVSRHLIDMQLDKLVELDDEEIKKAQETLAETKESLKDNFEMLVQSQGYKDEEDYYNNYILASMKIEKLFNMYVDENLETIMEENNTRKVRILNITDKANAEKALEELKAIEDLDGEKFAELAKTYAPESEEAVAESRIEHVYTGREKDTYLNTQLKDKKPGLIDELIMTESGFAIILIEEIDLETDKESIISSFGANETISKKISGDMHMHYASVGGFKIHDQELSEMFEQDNPFKK